MYTPRTPRSRITLLAGAMLLTALNQGKAQETTLQPLSEYEASLKTFHAQKRDAARTEYQQVNKRKWWYYLPNAGLGLAYPVSLADRNGTSELTTRARLAPNLNLGTGVLANIDQTKSQQKARLSAIDADAQFQYRTELQELRNRYQAIKLEQENVSNQESVARLETSLFNVAEDANRQKEIKPADYQQAKLLLEQQRLKHANEQHQLQLKILELERFARYRFPDDEL